MENTTYADIFAALGNEHRLALLRLLLRQLPAEMSVGELQQQSGMAASTLSHHLERLRRENIVCARKDKQWIWYSANMETLQSVADFVARDCCSANTGAES